MLVPRLSSSTSTRPEEKEIDVLVSPAPLREGGTISIRSHHDSNSSEMSLGQIDYMNKVPYPRSIRRRIISSINLSSSSIPIPTRVKEGGGDRP